MMSLVNRHQTPPRKADRDENTVTTTYLHRALVSTARRCACLLGIIWRPLGSGGLGGGGEVGAGAEVPVSLGQRRSKPMQGGVVESHRKLSSVRLGPSPESCSPAQLSKNDYVLCASNMSIWE